MSKKNTWNPKPFTGPAKSICSCGHTGDGPNSQHDHRYSPGHGPCKECVCKQFTWKEWAPDFIKHHNL